MHKHIPLRPDQLPLRDVPIFSRPEQIDAFRHRSRKRHEVFKEADNGRMEILNDVLARLPQDVNATMAQRQLELNLNNLNSLVDFQERMDGADPIPGIVLDVLPI